jgi:Holliday junction resolvasome RuvABC DNA-binding subunit
MATHRGTLVVDGDEVRRPNAPPPTKREVPSHVGSPSTSRLDDAILRTQARDALVGLGWKATIARTAVEEAISHVGSDTSLEDLIREALRRCPRPG